MASLSIIETMLILKKSRGDISKNSIQNCFRKAGISAQCQESIMDENDNPFKEVVYSNTNEDCRIVLFIS